MKARPKKAFAKEKKERFLTGGGPYQGKAIDLPAKVKSLLSGGLFTPLVNVNDDDVIYARCQSGGGEIMIIIYHIDLMKLLTIDIVSYRWRSHAFNWLNRKLELRAQPK